MLKVKTDCNFGIIHNLLRVNPVCVCLCSQKVFSTSRMHFTGEKFFGKQFF